MGNYRVVDVRITVFSSNTLPTGAELYRLNCEFCTNVDGFLSYRKLKIRQKSGLMEIKQTCNTTIWRKIQALEATRLD
jgi:phage FluMu protein gp41